MGAERRSILITGASSGIGRHLAVRLAGLGHLVFATARTRRDLEALQEIPGVVAVALDVRRPDQVRAAVERIEQQGAGLYGLVNNAGLGGIGPVATWTEDELLEIFDVNALAPVRMSQACLPLLLRDGGRIVNIGSQGGSISKRYFGPYTMTKHALEALTVALDEELAPYGVRASIVQPGGVASAIGENSLRSNLARFGRARDPFREEAAAVLSALSPPPEPESRPPETGGPETGGPEAEEPEAGEPVPEEPESDENRKPSSPEVVAVAVLDALFSPEPRLRYMVGTRWEGERVTRALLERLLDANDCPSLRDPVETLVEQLRSQARDRHPPAE